MKWTGMKLAGLILMLMTVLSPKVSASWIVETPDTGEETGRYTSIALDSKGNPHICYDDNATSSVKHAWKDNSGWHTETVESSGSANLCTSLAIDSKDTLHLVYFIILRFNLRTSVRSQGSRRLGARACGSERLVLRLHRRGLQ